MVYHKQLAFGKEGVHYFNYECFYMRNNASPLLLAVSSKIDFKLNVLEFTLKKFGIT